MTNIEDFNYDLPDSHIARYPVTPRDTSKLLVYNEGKISNDHYYNLPNHLLEDSLLIINNSKVIEARLHFRLLKSFHFIKYAFVLKLNILKFITFI